MLIRLFTLTVLFMCIFSATAEAGLYDPNSHVWTSAVVEVISDTLRGKV